MIVPTSASVNQSEKIIGRVMMLGYPWDWDTTTEATNASIKAAVDQAIAVGADSVFLPVGDIYFLNQSTVDTGSKYPDPRVKNRFVEYAIDYAHSKGVTIFYGTKLNLYRSYTGYATYFGTSLCQETKTGTIFCSTGTVFGDVFDWNRAAARDKWIALHTWIAENYDFDGIYVDEGRLSSSTTGTSYVMSYTDEVVNGVIAEHGYNPRLVSETTTVKLDMLHEYEKHMTQMLIDFKSNLSAAGAAYEYPYYAVILLETPSYHSRTSLSGAKYAWNMSDWGSKGAVDMYISQDPGVEDTREARRSTLESLKQNTPGLFRAGVLRLEYYSCKSMLCPNFFEHTLGDASWGSDFEFIWTRNYLNKTTCYDPYDWYNYCSPSNTTYVNPYQWLRTHSAGSPRTFNPIGQSPGSIPVTWDLEANPTSSFSNIVKERVPDDCFNTLPAGVGSCGKIDFIDTGHITDGAYRSYVNLNQTFNATPTNVSLFLTVKGEHSSRTTSTTVELYKGSKDNQVNYTTWNRYKNQTTWDNAGYDWIDKTGTPQGSTPYCSFVVEYPRVNSAYSCDISQLISEEYPNSSYEMVIKASSTDEAENNSEVYFYSFNSIYPPTVSYNVSSNPTPQSVVFEPPWNQAGLTLGSNITRDDSNYLTLISTYGEKFATALSGKWWVLNSDTNNRSVSSTHLTIKSNDEDYYATETAQAVLENLTIPSTISVSTNITNFPGSNVHGGGLTFRVNDTHGVYGGIHYHNGSNNLVLFSKGSNGTNLREGDFASSSYWTFYTSATGSFVLASGWGKVTLTTVSSNMQLYQKDLTLKPNTNYTLSFKAYSSGGRDMRVALMQHVSPYTNYGLDQIVPLTAGSNTFTYSFTTTGFAEPVSDARLRFVFNGYALAGDIYYIDDVVLTESFNTGISASIAEPTWIKLSRSGTDYSLYWANMTIPRDWNLAGTASMTAAPVSIGLTAFGRSGATGVEDINFSEMRTDYSPLSGENVTACADSGAGNKVVSADVEGTGNWNAFYGESGSLISEGGTRTGTQTVIVSGTTYQNACFTIRPLNSSGTFPTISKITLNAEAIEIPAAPTITSWGNNVTSNDNYSLGTIQVGTSVRFNITADQGMDAVNWYVDSAFQQGTGTTFDYTFAVTGNHTISVYGENVNGTTNTITWFTDVVPLPLEYPPNSLSNVAVRVVNGNLSILWDYPVGGNITDEVQVFVFDTEQGDYLLHNSTAGTGLDLTDLTNSTYYKVKAVPVNLTSPGSGSVAYNVSFADVTSTINYTIKSSADISLDFTDKDSFRATWSGYADINITALHSSFANRYYRLTHNDLLVERKKASASGEMDFFYAGENGDFNLTIANQAPEINVSVVIT